MRALLAIGALGLASCQPVGIAAPGTNDAFAREIAGLVVGAPQNCISAMPSQSPFVIDSRTIAYRSGTTLWVNRLPERCPVLSPHNTLIVETSGGQYCRGDHVRGIEPGGIIPGPVCILREWVPYRTP